MKNSKTTILIFVATLVVGCSSPANDPIDQYSYNLGAVGGFSELIAAGVKQLALSATMTSDEMDRFIPEAEKIAASHGVSIYREADLIKTDLFPQDIAEGLEVLVLYKGTTKDQYLNLKTDQKLMISEGIYDQDARRAISRRFGRMLSYSSQKINQLLAENSSFRTMANFGIKASNIFLYYKDLKAASEFYRNTLGMEQLADYGMATIFRIATDSYLILVDATKGMHNSEEPKTVALALLTEQLDEWYRYLVEQNVQIKYDYNPKVGSAHDGFVAYDPEGYLLEFERFNQHPENERFIPVLNQTETITDQNNPQKTTPPGLGFNASITWLYYKDVLAMQEFQEDVFGLEMIADQGWAKIYKVRNSAYIGLVDERRGMHQFTEKKAVNVSFLVEDIEGWYKYVVENQPFELRSEELSTGPDNKYKAFVGFDPEGYFLEFDKFYEHADNTILMNYLNSSQEN